MCTYNFAESAHSKCFGLVSGTLLLATSLLMKVMISGCHSADKGLLDMNITGNLALP